MKTIKTADKKSFFNSIDELKKDGKEWIQSNEMRSPRAFNYILITDDTFTFISKKEYEFWNR